MPRPAPLTHLLYLHGFRSSPQSVKAQQMAVWASQQPDLTWVCPQLPPSPQAAMALIGDLVRDWPEDGVAVVGSSLGGFYAAALGNRRPHWRVALLNPAVDPARDLAAYIGEQHYWHRPDEAFYFQPEFVQELQALQADILTHPARWFALIAKGDELLDWREMMGRYGIGRTLLLAHSDHALSDFERWQAELIRFLTQP
ncbi:YqiA/YcfP family alpha/beta fold hydrolase [Inhella gelatinilytica]|uniref:Esterase n=1 Tax=Inhella gelatinilytica TaxID=2795030 RepID=A0A931J0N6_9BURK|nr:YqiA/YcfP family alpha/beta fold hydrolase [Inhella gelatinilytica]MBH9553216.1 esterase [Inhella gelatinilytica]